MKLQEKLWNIIADYAIRLDDKNVKEDYVTIPVSKGDTLHIKIETSEAYHMLHVSLYSNIFHYDGTTGNGFCVASYKIIKWNNHEGFTEYYNIPWQMNLKFASTTLNRLRAFLYPIVDDIKQFKLADGSYVTRLYTKNETIILNTSGSYSIQHSYAHPYIVQCYTYDCTKNTGVYTDIAQFSFE